MESLLLPNQSSVYAITVQNISVKRMRQEHCTCHQEEPPWLAFLPSEPTSQEYKNFEFCFWGHRFELLVVQLQEVWEMQSWASLADTDLEWLTPTKAKDLSDEYLFSRSETTGYRGFTGQKSPLEPHPETWKKEACHVQAENTQLSTKLQYPAPALAFRVIKVELMQSGCDVASPGDSCPADETQHQHLKAVAAVCWAVGRKKESLLLKCYSALQEQETQLCLERAAAANASISCKADRLYACLPGTNHHTMYLTWMKLLLLSLFWPQAYPRACVWQLQQSLALLAAPGDSDEPCKGRSGRVRGERQWLPASSP